MTWINADDVARAVLEARSASSGLSPIHIQHPRPVPWNDIFGPIATNYGVLPVPFDSWFESLCDSAQDRRLSSSEYTNYERHTLPVKSTLSSDTIHEKITTQNDDLLHANPALKLLSFFSSCNDTFKEHGVIFPRLDTTKSQTLAAKKSLGEEMPNPLGLADVKRWLAYWENVGFLPTVLHTVNRTDVASA